MKNQSNRAGIRFRRLLALMLSAVMACSCFGALAAGSAGGKSSDVTSATTKYYVRFTSDTNIFTGETTGTGTVKTIAAGSVLQLVNDDYYTVDGTDYLCLYYNSVRYNVLYTDVSDGIFGWSEFVTYAVNTLWQRSSYATLKVANKHVGDVNVAGLQFALSTLGYYDGSVDGDYGDKTASAVKDFQRAYKLTADGSAGPLTQAVIYPLALAEYGITSSSGSSSGTGTAEEVGGSSSTGSTAASAGTVTSSVSVNLRKSPTTSSARLDVVPKGTTMSYTTTSVVAGITWYNVSYNGLDGWVMGTYVKASSSGGSSSSGGTATAAGTLKTTASVNLRKSATTNSTRLAVVPMSSSLNYYATNTVSGVIWYNVNYNGLDGWLMGTYVNASGSSGSTTTSIGTVTITMASTRVRKTANGDKTGVVLAKGTVVPLLSSPTTAGGYTWYNIRTASGVVGYVRGDCATASMNGSSGITPSTNKTYIKLSSSVTLFTSQEQSSTGAVTVASGTVLQMVSDTTYEKNGTTYCSVYYNSNSYNCVYSDVSGDIMDSVELAAYITGTMWPSSYSVTLKEALKLTGDIRVHSLQYALSVLGYYTGALDGNFGSGTTTAVKNFQRKYSLTVDGSVGPKTYAKLYPAAIAALNGGGSSSGGESGGSAVVADFGTITSIEKANWSTVDGGTTSLFKKSSTATVMDVATGKVFTVYRWSGGSHADCVPYTSSDTKTMCDIVGFPYSSSAPSSSQLSKIKGDTASNNATYTWPDFKGTLTSASSIGSAWDRRPALLNVNGRVFCVSIYGWPHGFNGTDSFSKSKFPNGSLFYAQNNYYGMMCIHFVGSQTHGSSTVDEKHQAAIETAYEYAKKNWPSLVKSGVQ